QPAMKLAVRRPGRHEDTAPGPRAALVDHRRHDSCQESACTSLPRPPDSASRGVGVITTVYTPKTPDGQSLIHTGRTPAPTIRQRRSRTGRTRGSRMGVRSREVTLAQAGATLPDPTARTHEVRRPPFVSLRRLRRRARLPELPPAQGTVPMTHGRDAVPAP